VTRHDDSTAAPAPGAATPDEAAEEPRTREPEPTLTDLWRRSAARASDTLLASLAAAGTLAVGAAFAVSLDLVPARVAKWWPLLLPPIAAGGFGLWGIAAREEAERRAARDGLSWVLATLVALRWLAALSAALALAVALVLMLTLALGTRTPG
jgi:hypothetical protein